MFRYTPFGWLLLIGSSLTVIAIVRSALVPAYPPADEATTNPPEWLALILFVVLLFGIVKWSWFGIFPYLAAFLITPLDLADRVWTASILGLFIGMIAYSALHIADNLSAFAKISLRRWSGRTRSALSTKHRSLS